MHCLWFILVCFIRASGAEDTIKKQCKIIKYRQSALTYGQAGSPADSTLYPPNSGGGQGRSAQSVSSGTRGLLGSHAEQKVMKHLECQDKTQRQAAVLLWPMLVF